MGLESPINQGAGTLTEMALTLPAHPKWVSLGKTNLSATGLVVKAKLTLDGRSVIGGESSS
ncbi:hypothetical protein [Aeromonas encheleia]